MLYWFLRYAKDLFAACNCFAYCKNSDGMISYPCANPVQFNQSPSKQLRKQQSRTLLVSVLPSTPEKNIKTVKSAVALGASFLQENMVPLVLQILNASIFLTACSVFIKRKRKFRGELEWKVVHNSEGNEGLGVILFRSRNSQFNADAASGGTGGTTSLDPGGFAELDPFAFHWL